jgi:excalibur calcium-binding domain-containing protein
MSLVRRALLTSAIVCGALFAASPMAIAQDKNCKDFPNQAAAQAELESDPSDPNNLDGDDDGYACESYFGEPSSTPVPVPTSTAVTPAPSTSKAKPTTKKPSGSQVKVKPVGGVATGDGSSSDDSGAYIALGGVVLVGAAAGTVLVARRRSGH